MAKILERYKKIAPETISLYYPDQPKTIIPKPTEQDYSKGYIQRYFFQRRDTIGSPIYEVSKDTFYRPVFPYKGVSLKWRIIGGLEDKWEGRTYIPSVITFNKKELDKVAKEMPDLKLYLVNLKQFWKPM